MKNIDGVGFVGAISADGRVVGGTITKQVETEFGPVDQERAALWTRAPAGNPSRTKACRAVTFSTAASLT